MSKQPMTHKVCTCPMCRPGGSKAVLATDAVNDLAAENARLQAELAAAQAEIARLKQPAESEAEA